MHVLLVTYYFPPAGGGGVQRPLGWCRFLPEFGCTVTVVAPDAPKWVDADPTLTIPAATHVVRTPDPSPPAVLPRAELAKARGPVQRFVTRVRLQPRRFALPDVHRRWRRPATQAALQALAHDTQRPPVDVVISSSPPETTHFVARDLARALRVPWIADFRDSWLDLPHLRLDSPLVRLKHRVSIRMATRLLADASAATTVSEPLADDLRRRHPDLPIHVIENGVDVDAVSRAEQRASGFRDDRHCVILYTGNFFGVQRPTSILDAVERLAAEHPDLIDTLRIRFVGGMKASDEARIHDSPALRAIVELHGFVRHDDVLASQRAADALLLYVAPGDGSRGVYTGKVFEYIAARRPVIALAPAGNVAARLVDEAGATDTALGGALADPDDVRAIAQAFARTHDVWKTGQRPTVDVPDEIIMRIDRRNQARRLAAIASDLV